jgi:hypothetical protein
MKPAPPTGTRFIGRPVGLPYTRLSQTTGFLSNSGGPNCPLRLTGAEPAGLGQQMSGLRQLAVVVVRRFLPIVTGRSRSAMNVYWAGG